jgi:hypothetical protein
VKIRQKKTAICQKGAHYKVIRTTYNIEMERLVESTEKKMKKFLKILTPAVLGGSV